MRNLLHDVDLGLDVFDVVGVAEYLLVDHFHSHRLSTVDCTAQVDGCVGTLPQKLLQTELVLLDLLLPLHQIIIDL